METPAAGQGAWPWEAKCSPFMAEPDWQVNCTDASGARLTSGRIGVWSMGSGEKYWDDLQVEALGTPTVPEPPTSLSVE